MKNFYFFFFLLLSFSLSAQEQKELQAAPNNEISVQASEEINGFRMFPNPVTTGKLNIYTQKNLIKEVAIYDLLGKQVYRKMLVNTQLDISDLSSGVYILRVAEDQRISTRKLVIQ